MSLLFELESDLVYLKLSQSASKEPAILPNKDATGRLILTKHRTNLIWHKVWRQGVPPQLENCPEIDAGPCLFEETDYKLYARCISGHRLDIKHSDPVIIVI